MVKAKMCIVCNRLIDVNKTKCPCGGTEFVEVILDFTEEEQDEVS